MQNYRLPLLLHRKRKERRNEYAEPGSIDADDWTVEPFQKNHPKFPKFLKAVAQNGMKEGSIIEIKVTTAEGESFDSNLKISADDMDMIEQLKKMGMNS